MRLLETTLRWISYLGIVAGTGTFLFVAIVAKLDETLTAALLFLSLIEVGRSYLTLRYIRRSRMEIRRRELEFHQPGTQWYSDRR